MNKSIQGQLFVVAEDIDWKKIDDGIERKILVHDDLIKIMMVSVCFEKGCISYPQSGFIGRVRAI